MCEASSCETVLVLNARRTVSDPVKQTLEVRTQTVSLPNLVDAHSISLYAGVLGDGSAEDKMRTTYDMRFSVKAFPRPRHLAERLENWLAPRMAGNASRGGEVGFIYLLALFWYQWAFLGVCVDESKCCERG